jgi:hypothetical protein
MRLAKPLLGCAAVAAVAAGALAAAGAFGGGTPSSTTSASPGEILFAGDDSRGRPTLYLMRPDGSHRRHLPRTLVPAGTEGGSPAWAPDGQRIALDATRPGGERASTDIYVTDLTGPARQITHTGRDRSPAWSPDGRRIAFSHEVPAPEGEWQRAELWTMNPDGTDQHRLTQGGWDTEPAWSPDGSRIAFTKYTFDSKASEFHYSLHVVPAAGGATRLVSDHSSAGAWSPDGSRLAVVDERDRNGMGCGEDECTINGEIYVINPDGSNAIRLTHTKTGEQSPSWSPDGARILFSSNLNYPDGYSHEIYSISASGGCPIRLTNDSTAVTYPAWRPGSGSGAIPRAGPCRRGYRSTGRKAVFHTDLRPARRFHRFPLYYLGKSFEGLLLTSASGSTSSGSARFDFYYDDCGRNPGKCGRYVNLTVFSMCTDHPLVFNPPLLIRPALRSRRVLALYDRGGGSLRLYTGRVAMSIDVERGPRDRRIMAALRRFAARGKQHALPKPEFPSSMMSQLERTERAYKELHSISRVRARLHISKYAVRNYLRLAAEIRRLGPIHTIHCPPLKPPRP